MPAERGEKGIVERGVLCWAAAALIRMEKGWLTRPHGVTGDHSLLGVVGMELGVEPVKEGAGEGGWGPGTLRGRAVGTVGSSQKGTRLHGKVVCVRCGRGSRCLLGPRWTGRAVRTDRSALGPEEGAGVGAAPLLLGSLGWRERLQEELGQGQWEGWEGERPCRAPPAALLGICSLDRSQCAYDFIHR